MKSVSGVHLVKFPKKKIMYIPLKGLKLGKYPSWQTSTVDDSINAGGSFKNSSHSILENITSRKKEDICKKTH